MAFFDCFVAVIFISVSLAWLLKARSGRKHYPPGPSGYPVIGNMFDMPSAHQWLTYAKWGKEHDSDIVHARILGQSIVVLNSSDAVTHLLDKRSSIYSDRPALTMLQDVLGFGSWNIPLMRYGLNWRLHRKCITQSLHANAVDAHHSTQLESARKLLVALTESPDKFRDHVNSHAGRIILKIMYGYDVKPVGDYYVALTDEAFRQFNEIFHTGKFYLVDLFPFLKDLPTWVPFFKFHRLGARFRALSSDTINKPYDILKARIDDGSAPPCIVVNALEKTHGALPSSREVEIIKGMASATYGAGQDTTASTISSFILAMALNPEQQKKAQKEIDSFTRGVRLPDFGDKSSLPYLHCILTETLRWAPAAPTGVPHRVMEDDVYKGYDIPAGSVVYGNIWYVSNNYSKFPI
jgi:cytochrome P450